MASRQSRYMLQKSATMKSLLWSSSSAPSGEGYTPLSGTPPSPSARQARLMSPSHSLPEFLPVLDESSTLKAPLVLPLSSYAGSANPLPSVRSSSSRASSRDLGRTSSSLAPPSILSARITPWSAATIASAGGSNLSSCSHQGAGSTDRKSLVEWVPHLTIFSLLCLIVAVASVAVSINYVEQHSQADTGTFFQISDIHWDPLYRYHASRNSFCRMDLLAAPDKPFGQYGCDSPLLLLKTALMEMSEASPRPDFVLVSGDSVAHNLSANLTLYALSKVDEAIAQAFDSRFTKRLHVLGVQELAVLDSEKLNFTDWLDAVARVWNSSLVEASDDAYDTFLQGGYYMAVLPSQAHVGPAMETSDSDVSSQTSNVAALVLNTLLYSTRAGSNRVGPAEDPAGQLAWLQEQLHQARHWGRKVVIAGHIPPGVDTMSGEPMWHPRYEQRFADIVLQHSDVVVGQLFGYLHRDHFMLMHADNSALFPDALASRTAPGGKQQGDEGRRVLASLPTSDPHRRRKLRQEAPQGAARSSSRAQATGQLGPRRRSSSSSISSSSSSSRRWQQDDPAVLDGGSSAAVLVAPSLSPMLLNRPAFRLFSYDRAGLLLDYKQHTADLSLQGAEKMWEVQYGARSAYGMEALDGSDFEDLFSSFFNSSGSPTETFSAFCQLRAAGSDLDLAGPYDCCSDCPNFMRCAVDSSTFNQFKGCNDSFVDHGRVVPAFVQ